mgnify:CR=1 FL=1
MESSNRLDQEPTVEELRRQLAEVENEIQEVRREVTHRHGPTLAEGPATSDDGA